MLFFDQVPLSMSDPEMIGPDDKWVHKCPACMLACQGGKAGLMAHRFIVHPPAAAEVRSGS